MLMHQNPRAKKLKEDLCKLDCPSLDLIVGISPSNLFFQQNKLRIELIVWLLSVIDPKLKKRLQGKKWNYCDEHIQFIQKLCLLVGVSTGHGRGLLLGTSDIIPQISFWESLIRLATYAKNERTASKNLNCTIDFNKYDYTSCLEYFDRLCDEKLPFKIKTLSNKKIFDHKQLSKNIERIRSEYEELRNELQDLGFPETRTYQSQLDEQFDPHFADDVFTSYGDTLKIYNEFNSHYEKSLKHTIKYSKEIMNIKKPNPLPAHAVDVAFDSVLYIYETCKGFEGIKNSMCELKQNFEASSQLDINGEHVSHWNMENIQLIENMKKLEDRIDMLRLD